MNSIAIRREAYRAVCLVKEKFDFGAFMRDLTDAERQRLQSNSGAYVVTVVNDSPAFNNNVLVGDVILAIDGESAGSVAGYTSVLKAHL